MRTFAIATAATLAALVGCSSPEEETTTPVETPQEEEYVMAAPAVEAWESTPAPAEPAAEETTSEATTETPAPPVEPEPAAEPGVPEGTELVEADTGVGARGRGYGGGIVSEPVRQYFRVEQQIAFRINIPNAMRQFQAIHERTPKSHEEFMTEIIEAYNIQLPELPQGQYYLYDPEAIDEDTNQPGVLMVARPAPE